MSQPLSPKEAQRLNELRERADLTSHQAAELSDLLARADAHETALLTPHTRALEAENQSREAENRRLVALVERRQRLANQLAQSLQMARAERRAIDLELQSILQTPAENRSNLAGDRR